MWFLVRSTRLFRMSHSVGDSPGNPLTNFMFYHLLNSILWIFVSVQITAHKNWKYTMRFLDCVCTLSKIRPGFSEDKVCDVFKLGDFTICLSWQNNSDIVYYVVIPWALTSWWLLTSTTSQLIYRNMNWHLQYLVTINHIQNNIN